MSPIAAGSFVFAVIPFPSIVQHLSTGACLDDKRKESELLSVLLCTTVVNNDTHTDMSSCYIFTRATLC